MVSTHLLPQRRWRRWRRRSRWGRKSRGPGPPEVCLYLQLHAAWHEALTHLTTQLTVTVHFHFHEEKEQFHVNRLPMSKRSSSPCFILLLGNKSWLFSCGLGEISCCVCKIGGGVCVAFVFQGEAAGSVNCCSVATLPACCLGNIQTLFGWTIIFSPIWLLRTVPSSAGSFFLTTN